MERITLHEELRLIERSESEVNSAWKGAHLLLFFLAFVFGSFCTFCFNMLMYLFDEKCVLFPKLLSLNSLRQNVIYEFLPQQKDQVDPLPVDFLSTQFVHKSACYLPTYVPLVSGIFGLVWTTMFLMCSSGSRSLSGLQRPWRVIVPVFVFSVAMSCLCIYSSVITHYGLLDLCTKLGEITGSSSCSYTVNVATLSYERQIRGVYQATRLTITSAWMHTSCWIASAILAATRVLLAVDFRLVKIRAELIGDLESMMERNERQLKTVMPSQWTDIGSNSSAESKAYSYFKDENITNVQEFGQIIDVGSDILFVSDKVISVSNEALLAEERHKVTRVNATAAVNKEHRFIVHWLYDILDVLDETINSSSSNSKTGSSTGTIIRQFGRQVIGKQRNHVFSDDNLISKSEAGEIIKKINSALMTEQGRRRNIEILTLSDDENVTPSTSKKTENNSFQDLTSDTPNSVKSTNTEEKSYDKSKIQKSNLKDSLKETAVQTDRQKKQKKSYKVTIAEGEDGSPTRDSSSDPENDDSSKKDESSQTKPKEKQD